MPRFAAATNTLSQVHNMQLDTARVDLLSIVRLANYIAVFIGWLCFLFLLTDESNRPALGLGLDREGKFSPEVRRRRAIAMLLMVGTLVGNLLPSFMSSNAIVSLLIAGIALVFGLASLIVYAVTTRQIKSGELFLPSTQEHSDDPSVH